MTQILANPPARDVSPIGENRLHRLWDAPAPLRLWHLASLDAPTVAVVWSLGFAWAAGVRLPPWAPLLLALVAWSVYIGDRLLDARAGYRTPSLHSLQERHRFHWRYRHLLAPLAIAAAIGASWIVVNLLPAVALKPDSVVAFAALAYFSGVHSHRRVPQQLSAVFSREFLVGVLFTAGCVLPVWSQPHFAHSETSPHMLLFVPMVFFACLAWLNCTAIGHWESSEPNPGTSPVFSFAISMGLIGVLLTALIGVVQPRSAALLGAGAASALLLAALDRMRLHITPLALRAAADLVLLTPILLLPFTPGRG